MSLFFSSFIQNCTACRQKNNGAPIWKIRNPRLSKNSFLPFKNIDTILLEIFYILSSRQDLNGPSKATTSNLLCNTGMNFVMQYMNEFCSAIREWILLCNIWINFVMQYGNEFCCAIYELILLCNIWINFVVQYMN